MKITDICDIEFRKKIPGVKNKSIIACSFFLMRESYKDITTYLNGLNQLNDTLIEHGASYSPSLYLRVYHDMSVIYSKDPRVVSIMQKFEQNPYVELVLYKPHQYVEDVEYPGLFGVIMRYFTYFAFEDNDTDYTYVIDIDFTDKQLELNHGKFLFDTLNKMRADEIDFIYENSICYMPFWKVRISDNTNIILGNMNGGRVKVDPSILKNFLDDFAKDKSQNSLIIEFKMAYFEYLLDSKSANAMSKKIISFKQDTRFVYGFDEFLVTYFIYPAILEQKNVKILVHTRNSYGGASLVLHRIYEKFIENLPREYNLRVLHFYYHLLKIIYNVGNAANGSNAPNNKIHNWKNNDTLTRDEMVAYISEEFPKFIEYFRYHDYEGKDMKKHRVYEKLYRIITEQYALDRRVLGVNTFSPSFKCLLLNDKYYYHDNSNEVLSKAKKEEILSSLLRDIHLAETKNNMNVANRVVNNKNKLKKRVTAKRVSTKTRKTTRTVTLTNNGNNIFNKKIKKQMKKEKKAKKETKEKKATKPRKTRKTTRRTTRRTTLTANK